jgi:methyltransferase (TIGR00027 family)
MGATARYTRWVLAIRTWIIDRIIEEMIQDGVDTVINLGAGLDTRPYRMDLPESLRWVEVDYPHMLEHKQRRLSKEKARCRLELIPLDLARRGPRQEMLGKVAAGSRKALVITEGVIPYLTEEQVGELADDLRAHPPLQFWVAEYFAPWVYPYLVNAKRMKRMRNAPFRFTPADWFGFFRAHGWAAKDVRYLGEASQQLKRRPPMPWWAVFFIPFMSKAKKQGMKRSSAYVIYVPAGKP